MVHPKVIRVKVEIYKSKQVQKINAQISPGVEPKMLSLALFSTKVNKKSMSAPVPEKKSERVIVYVDGFNLYFGMLQAGFSHYKWLSINKLINSFLQPGQELVEIKYFTSRVGSEPAKQKRQTTFIEALESTGIKIDII